MASNAWCAAPASAHSVRTRSCSPASGCRASPPDLLFVTTEMLNRGLSDLNLRRPLGIDAPAGRKPRMMLLDEIHTYDGTTGAQAAMVLRRWHHSVQAPITFVGLSATLSNPIRHMADLTGVADEQVTSITPEPEELEYEGAEYLLALRSDPTSGASVLSTTIQTSMLLPRAQDEPASRVSSGVYGTKAFVFTDDLDVTNRLFSYLLDAEGQRYSYGKPNSIKPPLGLDAGAPLRRRPDPAASCRSSLGPPERDRAQVRHQGRGTPRQQDDLAGLRRHRGQSTDRRNRLTRGRLR